MKDNEEELGCIKNECPIKVPRRFIVCVTVCKKEEGKYCLDFVLLKGDREAFLKHFKQFLTQKELLWPYHNATI